MIREQTFVSIGGVEQWVAINGGDREKPVIVFLHGGPAEAQSPFLNQFAAWERAFTIVNWDQRGAGKTFARNGPDTPDMTLDQMVADAIEVADYARVRLSKKKVILAGHSWGAILGLNAIVRRPDLFAAFVGTGFPVTWTSSLEAAEAWARRQAAAAGDQTALQALADAATLPAEDIRRLAAAAKWRMSSDDLRYLAMQRAFSETATSEARAWTAGGGFSIPKLFPIIASFDAYKLGAALPVPLFVIQGRGDHVVSFDAARAYVDTIAAPAKAFVPIEGGHFALFTNHGAFVSALRTHVLPAARLAR